MNPIAAAVARPYTVAVAVILAVLFGVLALRDIPVQLKPQVDTPRISITTNYRGASAVEVEEQVTRELEEVLQSVEGITEMVSDSSEGRSAITLEFNFGTDTRLAVVDVINKLSRVERLPPEADEPEVSIDSGAQQLTVMWIALRSGYSPNEQRRLVEDEIKARLERVPGVASIFVAGGSDREVQVRVDPELMLARGVTFNQLFNALAGGNLNLRGGTVETRSRQFSVRTVGRVVDPQRLGDIILKEVAGAGSVRLSEVATVVDGYRESVGFVNISGVPGVALGVRRQPDANVVDLIERLDTAIDGINTTFSHRGIDVGLNPVYRETTYIKKALAFVTDNLLLGSGLAVVVLLLFLRSARSVLIVGLSIPISLVTVFLVMQAMGRTLNVISLAGIAFASGMVVDNAIVVLENIFRHLELGKGPVRAAVDGGREVWGGVLASTLTTVAVFVPILLQGDEAAALFADMALAISAAVTLSLAVALTVVPVLASLLYKGSSPGSLESARATTPGAGADTGADANWPQLPAGLELLDDDGAATQTRHQEGLGFLGRAYARFTATLVHKQASAVAGKLGLVLLVLAVSLVSVRLQPPAEYLPTGNRNLVFFFAAPIPGQHPEAIRRNMRAFEQFVLAQPETDRMFALSGPFFNGGGVVLKDQFADATGLADFHQRLYGPAATLAGFLFFVPVRSSLFEDPGKQFEVELSGPSLEVLEGAAAQLTESLGAVPGVEFVRSSLVSGQPQLVVRLQEERAKDLGLDVGTVGAVVETMIAGRRLTAIIEGGREVDVNVLAPPEFVGSPEALAAVRFLAEGNADGDANGETRNGGKVINLASVATIERTTGPQSIRRLERERNVLLTVNIGPLAPLESVVASVEDEVFPTMAANLGPAYTLAVGGSADKLKSTLAALSGGFGLSVLIIYLLLVSLFRSWWLPFVILVTVPLALTGGGLGIRLAHELTGGQASFDVIAMLGFVILAGLVVNNAILIVHQTNNFRGHGLPPRDALRLAAQSRLRPILMTVITTVSAMLPLALGGGAGAELYQGLGAVIVGGLLVSTLFTLFLVPVLLSLGLDLAETLAARPAPASGEQPSQSPEPQAG